MSTDQGDMLGLVKSRQALDVAPVVLAGLLLDPETGETLAIGEADDETLVHAVARIRAAESELRQAKVELGQELIGRMDKNACWTLQAGAYVVSAPSPYDSPSYDPEALGSVLEGLVASGEITSEASGAALEYVVTKKVKALGVAKLLKLGGRVAGGIMGCEVVSEPAARYVRVKRA